VKQKSQLDSYLESMAFGGKKKDKAGTKPTIKGKKKKYDESSEEEDDDDFEEEDEEDEDDLDDLEEESDIVPAASAKKRGGKAAPPRATRSSAAAKGGKTSRVVMEEKTPKEEILSTRTRPTRRSQKEEDKMDVDEEEGSGDTVKPLAGIKIVCSGEFESVSRKKLEEIIETLGATKNSAVSSRTHYLLVGYKLEDGR
jgi:NAD-dependent DNA ligase